MLDAYHQCLGIARGQETPTWYQLLGVAVTERDPSVLEQAAVTRSSQVRVYQLVRTPDARLRALLQPPLWLCRPPLARPVQKPDRRS
jgi:hypothetical protein